MTEDQAKQRWCPFYQVATSGGDSSSTYEMDNRPPFYDSRPGGIGEPSNVYTVSKTQPLQPHACCLGSGCMAWIETKPGRPAQPERAVHYREKTRDDPLDQDDSKPLLTRVAPAVPAQPAEGDCGLKRQQGEEMTMERPFSPRTLAEHWGVKPALVMKICREKRIRCFQVGREYRITPKAVQEYEAGAWEDTGSADTGESGAPSGTMAAPVARVLALKRAKRTARRLSKPSMNGSQTAGE